MIRVGREEAFGSPNVYTYWNLDSAIGAFERVTKMNIREVVALTQPDKTLEQIVLEGGSIEYGPRFEADWISFGRYTEEAIEQQITKLKASIEKSERYYPENRMLPSNRAVLKDLENQLQRLKSKRQAG